MRCSKCFLTPPHSFELPVDFHEQLVAAGLNPQSFRVEAWRDGLDKARELFEFALLKEQERKAICQEWVPRLREFEQACRRKDPCPNDVSISPKEREKQRIYEESMRRREPFLVNERREAIFIRCPVLAIAVAKQLWVGKDDRLIFLTLEECSEWWERVYCGPSVHVWWWVDYTWFIKDPPDPPWSHLLEDGREFTFGGEWIEKTPPGEEPWELVTNTMSGGLSGESRT